MRRGIITTILCLVIIPQISFGFEMVDVPSGSAHTFFGWYQNQQKEKSKPNTTLQGSQSDESDEVCGHKKRICRILK